MGDPINYSDPSGHFRVDPDRDTNTWDDDWSWGGGDGGDDWDLSYSGDSDWASDNNWNSGSDWAINDTGYSSDWSGCCDNGAYEVAGRWGKPGAATAVAIWATRAQMPCWARMDDMQSLSYAYGGYIGLDYGQRVAQRIPGQFQNPAGCKAGNGCVPGTGTRLGPGAKAGPTYRVC